jgi:predicted adenine nucleotide alpha hydrolase (AANH) superfamily ATPase
MKTLLHICCGICAASVGERLISEGHDVTGYFYNPNIHPLEEFRRRLKVAEDVADWLRIRLIVPTYEPEKWLEQTQAFAEEPEGGKRCAVCFRIRLNATFNYLKDNNFESFTTTLTVSPHKSALMVNRIGTEIGGNTFLARDFKKKDGFKRSNEIARELGLYHQRYCGCIYSLNASQPQKM